MLFRMPKSTEPELLTAVSDYSIFDLAEDAGFLLLNPSDLVFEANKCTIDYYDYIVSVAQITNDTYNLYLAKLNEDTNVESYETVEVPKKVIKDFELPDNELALVIIAVLTWKAKISRRKVLCLINTVCDNTDHLFQALKKAMAKMKCSHHVICFEKRKAIEGILLPSRPKWHESVADSMRLRVMMCEMRSKMSTIPIRAIREARYLLSPTFSPLCCLCLPFS